MKKLITIPDELVKPLKLMQIENEFRDLQSQIVDILRNAVETHKAKSFLK